jgi:uncharacterized membrane protein
MAAPDIGSCLSAGIDGLKKKPLEHILAVVLVGAVGGVSAGVLSGPMVVGYMRMIERQERGEKVDFTDVFKGFDDFVPALLAVLLSSLIVSVGFMLCFLPGLLIVGLVPTAAYLVAVGEKDGINAIRRAFEAIKANLLGTVVCSLVLSIVGSLGAIFCGIGAFLTLPIAFIGFYHMARQITDGGPLVITQA